MKLPMCLAVCQATTNCSEVTCQQWSDCILSPNSTNNTVWSRYFYPIFLRDSCDLLHVYAFSINTVV